MNRREFFGAGAGIALGAAGVEAKEKEEPKKWKGSWKTMWPAEPMWIISRPELELGHSARIKVQRYPGAKFVPVHRERDLFNQFVNRFRQTHWWNPDFRIESIEPIITNCIMGS